MSIASRFSDIDGVDFWSLFLSFIMLVCRLITLFQDKQLRLIYIENQSVKIVVTDLAGLADLIKGVLMVS